MRRFKILEPLRVRAVRRSGDAGVIDAARISFVIESEEGEKIRASDALLEARGAGEFFYRLLTAGADERAIEALAAVKSFTLKKGVLVDLVGYGITPGAILALAAEAAAARGRDLKYAGRRIADARRRCEAAARALARVQELRVAPGDRPAAIRGDGAIGRAMTLAASGKFPPLGPGGGRLIVELRDTARALADLEKSLRLRGRPSDAAGREFARNWGAMARDVCGDSLWSAGAEVWSLITGRPVSSRAFAALARAR